MSPIISFKIVLRGYKDTQVVDLLLSDDGVVDLLTAREEVFF
jgi:hypothetical protein